MKPILVTKTPQAVVCAWCGQFQRWQDGRGVTGASHAICAACRVKFFGGEG